MSDNDPTVTPPTPSHVVPGDAPDPVVSTAPSAPPAPDEGREEDVDELLSQERPVVIPPAGPQTGVAVPPAH
ncbi:hypothetical protein [Cellulomonas uda]|uniref:Uncharacterized protein n=1 Tax=Cellulomonas uda TaxID=1714 RepID=A0A4Y3KCR7_CELUD|nr:hypothetical protein [Cellulomonas uda]NII66693.1 hypothetical protein [Cellulomonas uda]GEA81762.1 hypothetical protein CUD01_22060 [Cellulomonas uda]